MLNHLSIKNAALISEAEIDFSSGLNMLTGETGAGKSMVIDSINFILGHRAAKDFIRQGEEEAVVSGLFVTENKQILDLANNFGANADDGEILIQRSLNASGRNNVKLNGKIITLSMLKDLSALLIDVHGQHEHQSLLNPHKHIELLDKFCDENLDKAKDKLKNYLKEYRDLNKKLKEINGTSGNASERMDFLSFQIKEIENAKLIPGEEDELNDRHKTLVNSENLQISAEEAYSSLYGSDDFASASDLVGSALRQLGNVIQHDKKAEEIYNNLDSIAIELDELKRELFSYKSNIDSDKDSLIDVENRIELIYGLKRKYGANVQDILDNLEKMKSEFNFLKNSKEMIHDINSRRKTLNSLITEVCGEMHEMRKTQGEAIEKSVESILHELGMKDALFKVDIEKKKEFSANGNDKVEFLISPNLGESLKPLAKIASGGEMSRIMLALKTVMADADSVETFIFDEIDSGVSGRTAQKVAEKLSIIAKKQQILCISHLPQIAAMADSHLLIEKSTAENRTITSVKKLDYQSQILEIGRLLGGAKITDATIAAAKELKDMAKSFKDKG